MNETTIVNTGDGNIINTGAGGRIDSQFVQVSSDSQQGTVHTHTTDREELVGEMGSQIQNRETENEVKRPEDPQLQIDLDEVVTQAAKKGFVSFNGLSIKSTFPKTWKLMLNYIAEKAPGAPTNVVDDDALIGVLLYTPRSITFDFFDQNEIYVNIIGGGEVWDYKINGNLANNPITNRVQAEYEGFIEAFKQLEQKLK